MSRIVVIGGHGKVARLAVPLLVADGHEVSAVVRNPDHVADVEADGARAVLADVESMSADDLAEVLHGHEVVVWSAGAGGGNPARTYAVDRDAAIASMSAAQHAGARRYVMVSYFGAGPNHGVPEGDSFFPYAEAKAAADEALEQFDLDWTILRPSRLTDDAATGRVEVGDGGTRGTQVSRGNVAAAIAAVVDLPSTIRTIIELNDGDEPIEEALP